MRPLPLGLRLCDTCGEARGTADRGGVSACYCSGVECTWCGSVLRRPISDYFDRRRGTWSHVPSFACLAHRCKATSERQVGSQWRSKTPDPDVEAYQTAMTELTWRLVKERH